MYIDVFSFDRIFSFKGKHERESKWKGIEKKASLRYKTETQFECPGIWETIIYGFATERWIGMIALLLRWNTYPPTVSCKFYCGNNGSIAMERTRPQKAMFEKPVYVKVRVFTCLFFCWIVFSWEIGWAFNFITTGIAEFLVPSVPSHNASGATCRLIESGSLVQSQQEPGLE